VGLYRRFVLPRLIHLACRGEPTEGQRLELVPLARGRVLEVGVGSGLNLPFYTGNVMKVWGLDPSAELLEMARHAAAEVPVDVELLRAGAEEIPLADATCDTVLVTYALCTIPDVATALREMRRVLAPGGRLLFCEHGLAPDERVRRAQNWVNPAWKRVGGGCHLNRDIPDLIRQAGFELASLETTYLPGWRPASFNYRGTAVTS